MSKVRDMGKQLGTVGMKVVVVFKDGNTETYRNVTEIHWRYPSYHEAVAFESDVHRTGITWDIGAIAEFEGRLEMPEEAQP